MNKNFLHIIFVIILFGCLPSFAQTDSASKHGTIKVSSPIRDSVSITPNGDGKNDFFSINSKNISQLEVKIYDNLNKELIYQWSGIDGRWDGKNLKGQNVKIGVYIFRISYFDDVGISSSYEGYINLTR